MPRLSLERLPLVLLLAAAPAALRAQDARLDSLDAFVRAQMARRHIAGLSRSRRCGGAARRWRTRRTCRLADFDLLDR